MKKIILAAAILLTICISVTMVSAEFYVHEINFENNVLTINGVNVTIPDGYQENESAVGMGEDLNHAEVKGNKACSDSFYKGNDVITVTVTDNNPALTLDDVAPLYKNVDKKKIGNHEGFLVDVNGGVLFGYIDDGRLVDILAPDENTLTSMLK